MTPADHKAYARSSWVLQRLANDAVFTPHCICRKDMYIYTKCPHGSSSFRYRVGSPSPSPAVEQWLLGGAIEISINSLPIGGL